MPDITTSLGHKNTSSEYSSWSRCTPSAPASPLSPLCEMTSDVRQIISTSDWSTYFVYMIYVLPNFEFVLLALRVPLTCVLAWGIISDVGVVALMVRDCYEAFVVYSFLTLILEHAGGDYNCIEQIKHLPPVPHPWPMCCLSHVRRDGDLLRLSKQATLQFVVVKPLMAIVILIVLTAGWYFLSPFQVRPIPYHTIPF